MVKQQRKKKSSRSMKAKSPSHRVPKKRPRSRRVLSSSAPSSSASDSSSESSSSATPTDKLYQLKDIVAEKIQGGKTFYKIDWEDDPDTGEVFEKTWEPAENVTEAAIAAWLDLKQASREPTKEPAKEPAKETPQTPLAATPAATPVPATWESLGDLRIDFDCRSCPAPVLPLPVAWASLGTIRVDLDHADRPPPGLASQFPHYLNSQLSTQLPPADPSCLSFTTASQPIPSQKTVPDSEEFSVSVPLPPWDTGVELDAESQSQQSSHSITGTGQARRRREGGQSAASYGEDNPSHQLEASRSEPSRGPDIPSHQPESPADPSTASLASSLRPSDSKARPNPPGTTSPDDREPSGDGIPDFLTQVPVGFRELECSSSSRRPLTAFTPRVAAHGGPGDSESIIHETPCILNREASQNAQIVPHLRISQTSLASQSQEEFSVYDDDFRISDSEWNGPRGSSAPDSQKSGEALSEVDGNRRKSSQPSAAPPGVASSPQAPPSDKSPPPTDDTSESLLSSERDHIAEKLSGTPTHQRAFPANMEGNPTTQPPMSAIEELLLEGNSPLLPLDTPITNPPDADRPNGESSGIGLALPSPPRNADQGREGGAALSFSPANARGDTDAFLRKGSAIAELLEAGNVELNLDLDVDLDLTGPLGTIGTNLPVVDTDRPIPTTVTPAELVTSTGADSLLAISHPTNGSSSIDRLAMAAPVAGQASAGPGSYELSTGDSTQTDGNTALVPITTADNEVPPITLALSANIRQRYWEAIVDNQPHIQAFSDVFSKDTVQVPDSNSIANIDLLFERLLDLCDMPAFVDSLPPMEARAMWRHATGSNSKFLFVHELLEGLRSERKQVLILSRPGRIIDYLVAGASSSAFRFRQLGEHDFDQNSGAVDPLTVFIGSTDDDPSTMMPTQPDVVIAFDQNARRSALFSRYLGSAETMPIALSLVATHTLEHLDLLIPRTLDPLERKNHLLGCTWRAKGLIKRPGHAQIEPHQVAEIFIDYIKEPTADCPWSPLDFPDLEVFDFFKRSGAASPGAQESSMQLDEEEARPGERKRPLTGDDEVANGGIKRPRLGEPAESLPLHNPVLFSETLRDVLGVAPSTKAPTVVVSVDVLESMATEIKELKAKHKDSVELGDMFKTSIRRLEAEVKSHVESVRWIQPKFMEALKDRGVFKAQHDEAVKTATESKAEAESEKATAAKWKKEKEAVDRELKAAYAIMRASDNPETARLAKMEDDLRQCQEKAGKLADKVTSQKQEMEFFQKAYQDASQEVTTLHRENAQMLESMETLKIKASDNMLKIQQINRDGQVAELQKMVREWRALVKVRENELERAREDARSARNGRRDTRQQSVPRSPRLGGGVMSPRHPSRGSGSRGTSPGAGMGYDGTAGSSSQYPVPGMGYVYPPSGGGSGRYAHLRD